MHALGTRPRRGGRPERARQVHRRVGLFRPFMAGMIPDAAPSPGRCPGLSCRPTGQRNGLLVHPLTPPRGSGRRDSGWRRSGPGHRGSSGAWPVARQTAQSTCGPRSPYDQGFPWNLGNAGGFGTGPGRSPAARSSRVSAMSRPAFEPGCCSWSDGSRSRRRPTPGPPRSARSPRSVGHRHRERERELAPLLEVEPELAEILGGTRQDTAGPTCTAWTSMGTSVPGRSAPQHHELLRERPLGRVDRAGILLYGFARASARRRDGQPARDRQHPGPRDHRRQRSAACSIARSAFTASAPTCRPRTALGPTVRFGLD